MIQHVMIQIVPGGERATDLPFDLSGLFLIFIKTSSQSSVDAIAENRIVIK